mmetsp:Transcript_14316/g.46720  ORF Transcript_14316/g.46720 Transcript_14316/m.46720 type:complete len:222 (+) Transcript_14316:778-1443(+)
MGRVVSPAAVSSEISFLRRLLVPRLCPGRKIVVVFLLLGRPPSAALGGDGGGDEAAEGDAEEEDGDSRAVSFDGVGSDGEGVVDDVVEVFEVGAVARAAVAAAVGLHVGADAVEARVVEGRRERTLVLEAVDVVVLLEVHGPEPQEVEARIHVDAVEQDDEGLLWFFRRPGEDRQLEARLRRHRPPLDIVHDPRPRGLLEPEAKRVARAQHRHTPFTTSSL